MHTIGEVLFYFFNAMALIWILLAGDKMGEDMDSCLIPRPMTVREYLSFVFVPTVVLYLLGWLLRFLF